MRSIKTFGLAAVAVGAFAACLGASLASAVTALEEVVICKVNEDPCAAGNRLGNGTVFHGEATLPLLHGSIFDIGCSTARVLGEIKSALAHGEITTLSFVECTRHDTGAACALNAERLNYLIQAELNSADTGYEVLVKAGPGGLRPEFQVICGSINCKYGSDHLILSVSSLALTTVLNVEQALTGLGFCFTAAEWLAAFVVKCLVNAIAVGCWPKME